MTDLSGITRVHVVAYGRSFEFWADNWHVFIQDGGRTLKLFQEGSGVQHQAVRDASLAEEITELW